MNTSKITRAMLNMGYTESISVEPDTFDIWVGAGDTKRVITGDERTQILATAETVD